MTNRTRPPPVAPHGATETQPPAPPVSAANRSIRIASITAGVGILLMTPLALFGNFVALQRLMTPGNATQTAADIIDSEIVFRFGIVSLFLVIALDVVVACALYRALSPVSRGISLLAAVFRIVFAGVFLVAISQLAGVLRLLGNDDYLAVFTADQLRAQALLGINTFGDVWGAGLFLFGLHLLIVGYLAYRSGYVPRVLGVLLAIAGAGYVIDSFGKVLSGGSWTDISMFTFIGEFLLALWLVIRGRRLTVA
jgi:hypothetical protein